MSAPALALLNAAGQVERSSHTFQSRYGSADAWRGSPELERVLAGETDRATATLDDTRVEIEAILDQDGARRVLLTIGADAAGADGARNQLLDERLDDYRALVWIKDLEGRYLRINNRYLAELGTSEDRLRGRTDADVPARETVDGPRLQGRSDTVEEPLELEYVVAPFEGRPALSALRFAIRDRTGQPIAVCGVAAPLAESAMAHGEAKRLIEIERFSRLDTNTLRAEFLQAHDTAPPSSIPPPGVSLPPRPPAPLQDRVDIDEVATAAAAERAAALARRDELDAALSANADLKQELDAQRRELAELHEAAATARGRAEELDRTLSAERERSQEVERALAQARVDAETARWRADELGREHGEAKERLIRLEQQLESDATNSEQRVRDIEQARSEMEHARGEADRARGEADRARAEADRIRSDAERAAAEADAARAEAEQARAEAEQARAEAEQARAELEQLRSDPVPGPSGDGETAFSAIGDLARGLELEQAMPVGDENADQAGSRDLVPGVDETGAPASVQWLPNAQRRLSASLARTSVWRTVLNETSSIIGTEGGWDAVTAWVPDGDGGLECAAMWTAHPGLGRFEEATWDAQHQRAGSLPAQALGAPHLTWVMEIDAVDDDRLGRAAAHGLRSALLLPVRDGSTPIALLELLAHASMSPDAQIAMSLEAAALQLGQLGHLLHVAA